MNSPLVNVLKALVCQRQARTPLMLLDATNLENSDRVDSSRRLVLTEAQP